MAFCLKKDKHHETKTRIYISGEAKKEGDRRGQRLCQGNVGFLHHLKKKKRKKKLINAADATGARFQARKRPLKYE